MFTVEDRERVWTALLNLARADPAVTGAAVTGSAATGGGDRWSDIDLALGVEGSLEAALRRWTGRLYEDLGALHHWDLPAGDAVYRVFLLPGCLEVDLAFAPAVTFGPRGPRWRAVFGNSAPAPPPAPPGPPGPLAGRGWHHVLHARASIERGRRWQAEYWIAAARAQVIALACRRLGHPDSYAKGAHLLPDEVTGPLEATLVRGLDDAELRRALAEVAAALATEVARADPDLADRLRPALAAAAGTGHPGRAPAG